MMEALVVGGGWAICQGRAGVGKRVSACAWSDGGWSARMIGREVR